MALNIEEKDGKKYIDGEEILIEYDCINRGTIVLIRIPIFLIMIYAFFVSIQKFEAFSFLWFSSILVFLLIPIWYILRDIKNFYHEGIYLTKNHLITFRGYKIPLDEIYFKTGAGGMEFGKSALSFYRNSSFIIFCIIKNNEEFQELVSVIYDISKNELFHVQDIGYDCKFCKLVIRQKLIIGE
jgi:hypothetical protein